MATDENSLGSLLATRRADILDSWLRAQLSASTLRPELLSEAQLRGESEQLLAALIDAWTRDPAGDTSGDTWDRVRAHLDELSRSRALDGYSPSETATFVFSIKQPVFDVLIEESSGDDLVGRLWKASSVVDRLGRMTMEAYQRTREEVIRRQQEEMIEVPHEVRRQLGRHQRRPAGVLVGERKPRREPGNGAPDGRDAAGVAHVEPEGRRQPHMTTVTVVPCPGSVSIVNSCTSRLAPPRPRPSPVPVVKPFRIASWSTASRPRAAPARDSERSAASPIGSISTRSRQEGRSYRDRWRRQGAATGRWARAGRRPGDRQLRRVGGLHCGRGK